MQNMIWPMRMISLPRPAPHYVTSLPQNIEMFRLGSYMALVTCNVIALHYTQFHGCYRAVPIFDFEGFFDYGLTF